MSRIIELQSMSIGMVGPNSNVDNQLMRFDGTSGQKAKVCPGITVDDSGHLTSEGNILAAIFDTNIAAAGVTLSGTTLAADGTDTNIDIDITPKGTGAINMPKVDIDAGAIDGCTIATSDITVGSGKTLDVSGGTFTLANDQISGDKIEGGTIAGITIDNLFVSTSLGIGEVSPETQFELWANDAHPILTITAAHATDYDPQIQYRTDVSDTVKFSMGVDGVDDKFKIFSGTGIGGTTEFVMDANGGIKCQNAVDSTTAYQWLDADGGNPIMNIDTTNGNLTISGNFNPNTDNDVNLGDIGAIYLDQFSTAYTGQDVGFGNDYFVGQSFTTDSGVTTLGQIKIFIKYNTGTQEDLICNIYLADGTSKPTGDSLGSKTISSISDASLVWVTFTFDTLIIGLSEETEYVFVISSPDSSANNTYMQAYNSSSVYDDGIFIYSLNEGSSWITYSGIDIPFKTYSAIPPETDVRFKNICLANKLVWDEDTLIDGSTSGIINFTGRLNIINDYLHVGDGGVVTYADGDGDVYIKDELEVGGKSYFLDDLSTYNTLRIESTCLLNRNVDPSIIWNPEGGIPAEMSFQNSQGANKRHLAIGIIVNNVNSNGYLMLVEKADLDTDWGISKVTDPHFRIQSADATEVDDYIEFYHNQTNANINWGNGNLNLSGGEVELTNITPYFTRHNITEEDIAGGRESIDICKGETQAGFEHVLAKMTVAHDLDQADQKGYWALALNDGDDGDSPTERLRIDSAGLASFVGDINIASGKVFKINSAQIIGAPQAHIVDADGTIEDITAKFNTLLSYLDADAGHGLLAGA